MPKHRYRVIRPHWLWQAGDVLTLDAAIGDLYAGRGICERIIDPDRDGRDEGGPKGEKKAFFRPPIAGKQMVGRKG